MKIVVNRMHASPSSSVVRCRALLTPCFDGPRAERIPVPGQACGTTQARFVQIASLGSRLPPIYVEFVLIPNIFSDQAEAE
jgi:hypothetical protein